MFWYNKCNMIGRLKLNPCIFCLFALLIYLFNSQTILKQPDFFKAFYCNLGTRTTANDGNYVCTSPRVIPQVDKCSLSLMQINKPTSMKVKFQAETLPTCLGLNIVSATVKLQIKSTYIYKLGFMIVAIGHQPANNQVSLFTFSLPDSPSTNPVYSPSPSPRIENKYFQLSLYTQFGSTTNIKYVAYISSFGISTTLATSTAFMKLSAINHNPSDVKVTIYAEAHTGIETLRGFVLVYDDTAIPGSNFQYSTNPIAYLKDIKAAYSIFGPSFSPKCIVGYTSWGHDSQNIQITFQNSTKGHYQFQKCTGNLCQNMLTWMDIFCLSSGSYECSEDEPYFDQIGGLCYPIGTDCPVPMTTLPVPKPVIPPYICKSCQQIDCITCNSIDRTLCTGCDGTKRSHLSGSDCVCDPGYYRPSPISYCRLDCTFHIPYCKIDACTNTVNCTECQINYGLKLYGSDYKCDLCINMIPHCQTCVSQDQCTTCESLYGFSILNECETCVSLLQGCLYCNDYQKCTSCQVGYVLDSVTKYCSTCSSHIKNCIECAVSTSTQQQQVYCTKCQTGYYLNKNQTCTRLDPGCASFHFIGNQPDCLYCKLANNYEMDRQTGTCFCKYGFTFNSMNDLCESVCGDGIKSGSQKCDDKNIKSNDGCDSNCKIEDHFSCMQNSLGLSKCVFLPQIQIKYDFTIRKFGQNQAHLYFSVTPTYAPLDSIDWKSALYFNLTEVSVSSIQYFDGVLIVGINYSADLDDKAMKMQIKFDANKFKSKQISRQIILNAINGHLIYETQAEHSIYKVINLSGQILGLICLALYLIATYFHKLIGLQTLQVLQLIYFVRLIFPTSKNSTFYAFNSLKYSNGYNDIFPKNIYSDVNIFRSMPSAFSKLNLKILYLQNCNTMLAPIGLAVLAYVIYSLRKARSRSLYIQQKDLFQKDNYVTLKRQVDWIYDNFIFSYTLGMLYVTTFELMLYQLSKMTNNNTINFQSTFFQLSFCVYNVAVFFILAMFAYEAITGIRNYIEEIDEKENVRNQIKELEYDGQATSKFYHPLYVPVYLCYEISLIVVLNLGMIEFDYVAQSVLAVGICYLILITLWKPYSLTIHNYIIIFNQSVAVGFVTFLLINKTSKLSGRVYNAFMLAMVGLISIIILLQIVRIYIHRKSIQQAVDLKNEQKQNNKEKYKIKNSNPFSIENQIKQALEFKNQNINEIFTRATGHLTRQQCQNTIKKRGLNLFLFGGHQEKQGNEAYDELLGLSNQPRAKKTQNQLQRTKYKMKNQFEYLHGI